MQKKVLLLADRHPLRNQLINLGDRAIYDGLYAVMEKDLHWKVTSGGWKNFPYFNISKFRRGESENAILEKFEVQTDKLTNYSNRRIKWEEKILHFLETNPLFTRGPLHWVERQFQNKMTLGLQQALWPYIFRAAYASRLIKKIKNADIVLMYGSGTADHVQKYLTSFLLEIYLAKKLGKKVATVNQTASFKNPLPQRILKVIYSLMDFHSTREAPSRDYLVGIGIPEEKILLSCDGAFGLSDSRTDVSKIIKREKLPNGYIAIQIRGDRKVDISLWKNIILKLKNEYGREVIFIHTCQSHDEKIVKRLHEKTGLKTTAQFYDYPIVIELLRHASLLITDRYHGAVFAMMSQTPLVTIHPHSHKIQGLTDLSGYPLKPCDMNEKQILENTKKAFKNSNQLKKAGENAWKELHKKLRQDLRETASRLSH